MFNIPFSLSTPHKKYALKKISFFVNNLLATPEVFVGFQMTLEQ
jgi:hypothetical protein